MLSVTLLAAFAPSGFAADPRGVWLVQDGNAKVKVDTCGSAICANVIWIETPNDPATGKPRVDKNNVDPAKRSRPLLGLTIATGMKQSDRPEKWIGEVYSIDHGRSVNGSLSLLSDRKLKIEGCLMLVCESETWTRVDSGSR
jgi:uncharacterized protein (DUF2147 family)